jgi:DNA (cytosine-5)-methyltransferase 1
MKPKFPFIDLFAGCGGLSLGLEQAGFTPVYVNELNKDAMNTYLSNREEFTHLSRPEFHSNDIFELSSSRNNLRNLKDNLRKTFSIKEGELSLVVGGPPCQGYSGIGHRRSYKVNKNQIPSNHLYREMVKVIKYFQPKAFIFENVRGLITARWTPDGDKGEIFKDVKNEFLKLKNYNISDVLIHSKSYGVPQNRPRVLIIGYHKRSNFKLDENKYAKSYIPEPTNDYPDPYELLSDLIDVDYEKNFITQKYITYPNSDIQTQLRTKKNKKSFFSKGDRLTEQEYSNHSELIKNKFKSMINNNGKIPEDMKTKKFAQRLIPKKWGTNGPNITATSLPDDYVHFSQPRTFTVREWARFQTFPDWYEFKGKRTTGGIRRAGDPTKNIFDRELPKYTQIGNAVPVELAKKLGIHIKKHIS